MLIVDVQNSEIAPEVQRDQSEYYQRIRTLVIPRVQRLIATARETGVEVVTTRTDEFCAEMRRVRDGG